VRKLFVLNKVVNTKTSKLKTTLETWDMIRGTTVEIRSLAVCLIWLILSRYSAMKLNPETPNNVERNLFSSHSKWMKLHKFSLTKRIGQFIINWTNAEIKPKQPSEPRSLFKIYKYSRRHFVTKNIRTLYEKITYSMYALQFMLSYNPLSTEISDCLAVCLKKLSAAIFDWNNPPCYS
jgi:hypothetical protein